MELSDTRVSAPDTRPLVLVVDDQPENLAVLIRMLQGLYRIRAARSGEQALKAVQVNPKPDLILLDIMMPDVDGYTVLTRIKSDPETENIPVIFVTALGAEEDEERGLALGAVDYINKPIKQSILLARVRTHLTINEQHQQLKQLNSELDAKVQERTRQLENTLGSLQNAHERLKSGFMSTVNVFSNLLEMREREMVGHSRRVANDARKVAAYLKLPDNDIQDILLAGLLHDIGKMGFSDQLFSRSYESLNPDERLIVMQHPERGANLLQGLDQFEEVARLIRHHHELYDGSGFPDNLKGEDIPLGARILSVANDFDALMAGHLIRKKLDRSKAMYYLVVHAGRRYDPMIVDIFFRVKSNAHILRDNHLEDEQVEGIVDGVVIKRRKKKHYVAQRLPIEALKPGMVLGKPISLSQDMLLLSDGYILTQGLINQLKEIQEQRGSPLSLVEVLVS